MCRICYEASCRFQKIIIYYITVFNIKKFIGIWRISFQRTWSNTKVSRHTIPYHIRNDNIHLDQPQLHSSTLTAGNGKLLLPNASLVLLFSIRTSTILCDFSWSEVNMNIWDYKQASWQLHGIGSLQLDM